jgi:transcription antitermination factor NusG
MRRFGLEPFVPTEERILYVNRHHTRRKQRTTRPLFPGLAFVELADPIRWDKVLAIPCVAGIFAPFGDPYRFLEADMVILGALADRPAMMPYDKGDSVRFVTGPMRDIDMTVASVDFRRGEVKLLADILGRITEINGRAGDVRREVA